MRVGVASTEITPPVGIQLAGYAFRDRPAEGARDELTMQVMVIEHDGTRVGMVTADVIWFDAEWSDEVRRAWIAADPQLTDVWFAASHTHGGPQTAKGMHPLLGKPSDQYLVWLKQTVLRLADQAAADLEDVTLFSAQGRCSFSVNRRRLEDGRVVMKPEDSGPRDDCVTVVGFRREDRTWKSLWFHYTCHPTVAGGYDFTADYPGAARRWIETALPGVQAMFLQGCCGDIRPRLVDERGAFYRGGPVEVERLGRLLGREVVRLLTDMETEVPYLSTESHKVEMPLQTVAPRPFLPDIEASRLYPAWRELVRGKTGLRPVLHIRRLQISERVVLYGFSAEMTVEYGLWLRRRFPRHRIIPVGYVNGCVGYLCPARYVDEGGYEVEESYLYFGLPAPFSREAEERVKRGIAALPGLRNDQKEEAGS
ncbi:hypothetical protein [Polycladomyces subterraneus]|uniref:Neutral/alkaline non-lysosomal ceramidase N-terminal domain-containing protein n=1 Tax=Polycladomyces subterraneus TaxID=1016997 RepID=A0ABT8ILH1_9BACL|nr:hypothetical protein [Polycladomyces subterraneus]MDN4593416.1 hypothetical protein [Polycladomyces subterraneus]